MCLGRAVKLSWLCRVLINSTDKTGERERGLIKAERWRGREREKKLWESEKDSKRDGKKGKKWKERY